MTRLPRSPRNRSARAAYQANVTPGLPRAPIGSEHIAAANALNRLLVRAVGDRGIGFVGNPVRLTRHSEPRPDFPIRKPRDDYRKTVPRPEDTMLAEEIANTSLDNDRKVRLARYARS